MGEYITPIQSISFETLTITVIFLLSTCVARRNRLCFIEDVLFRCLESCRFSCRREDMKVNELLDGFIYENETEKQKEL